MDIYELDRRKKVILDFMNAPVYRPMKLKEIAACLNIEKPKKAQLFEVLDELVALKKIKLMPNGRYKLAGKTDTCVNEKEKVYNLANYKAGEEYSGIYTVSRNGFAFVSVDQKQDVFISGKNQNTALNGDKVIVRIIDSGRKKGSEQKAEGSVIKVTEHVNKHILGLYKKNKKFGFVVPDDKRILKDIYVPAEKSKDALDNTKVLVRIDDYGSGLRQNPEGTVEEILGDLKEPGVDILSIIKVFGFPEDFEKRVKAAANRVALRDISKEIDKRIDLRYVYTVTIDKEDAKDLDDAVSLEFDDGIWKLGVHIADVSHYVKEGGLLDKEACERGTSVYFPDRVIPMFPAQLSNGCCSLNANEDKLTLSCIMDIDSSGKVISHKICETVIRVKKRLSYNYVFELLENQDKDMINSNTQDLDVCTEIIEDTECRKLIYNMHDLALLLRKKRFERGSIDFDLPESSIILNTDGSVKKIQAYNRTVANIIIEEFMLAANETVAQEYFWLELPFIYRVHDTPDMEKMRELSAFINNFGFSVITSKNEMHPKEIQKLLNKIYGTEAEAVISRMVLRSMKQARYQVLPGKHFGLAAQYYTHFTSPIRRYPDLQIHRIIKENIKKGISDKRRTHYMNILDYVASHSSAMERRANDAERDAVKYKMCEYMQTRIGCVFDGIISGMTKHGMYVALENTIEGFISMADIGDDYYFFDSINYETVGQRSNKIFRLGDSIKIVVAGADKMTRVIDFIPYGKKKKRRK